MRFQSIRSRLRLNDPRPFHPSDPEGDAASIDDRVLISPRTGKFKSWRAKTEVLVKSFVGLIMSQLSERRSHPPARAATPPAHGNWGPGWRIKRP